MQRISVLRYFKGKYFRSIDYILFKSDAENLKFDVEWLTVYLRFHLYRDKLLFLSK